jgi:iron complex transport system permease protein
MGLGAVLVSYVLAGRLKRSDPILTLVLTGLVVTSVFSALISAVKYVADPYSKLPAITFWLMGSLATITRSDLFHLLVPIAIGSIALIAVRWHLNALAFGEEEAQALGVQTRRLRLIVVGTATLMTAVCVSICGMIGWVGLIIPHLARSLVGPDYRRLMPVSAVLGALFLVAVDDLARSAAVEIPIGILTALIGAPVFLVLMARVAKGWR